MSNSPMVVHTNISPNSSNPRNQKISKITIHHMAGNLSVETCGNVFKPSSRQASSNYGVGSDGRVGMYVEEKNRSWCSSSPSNDNRAVTIEVANNGGAPDWRVSDKALEALINLCVDIVKRNPGIRKADGTLGIYYDNTANASLTRHNMFANTTCPGPYLQSKFPYIVEEVNKRLAPAPQPTPPAPEPTPSGKLAVGTRVRLHKGAALYYTSGDNSANGFAKEKETVITRNNGSKHYYNTTGDYGWMDASGFTVLGQGGTTYTVVAGDTLSGIGKKLGKDWTRIYQDNKSVIGSNPNLIKPGQVLKIY